MNALRQQLVDYSRRMAAEGLNKGTAGNLSVRVDAERFLITPTGVAPDALEAESLPLMTLDGHHEGPLAPSSEWRFHRDGYLTRPNCGAILHAHSPFATALACLGRDIPAFHYMIARFGGDNVRCAPYATFGSEALAQAVAAAMAERNACLLAHHGMLVSGHTLKEALDLAVEMETLCEQYWRACAIGSPATLPAAEMAVVIEKFRTYGQPQSS